MKKILAIITLFITFFPSAALAASFSPNYIISDLDLVNAESMSVTRLQKFLSSKGSLGSYLTLDPWGNTKSAAQVIYDAGNYWRINPQYLIVRMQIEQSLITDPAPSAGQLDWATGYAVCDSCSKEDPAVKKFKGFFNQVNWAARRIRETYLPDLEARGMTFTGWGPGITKRTGDGYYVTPVNNATSVLYTYTPYVYNANYNIWRYWNQWFTKHYPDGSLLRAEGEKGVYLIQYGKKRPFLSWSALVSRYDPSRIIIVSRNDLDMYEDGQPIKFANYSLVRSQETGRVYLIDGDTKRYIESPEVFRQIGFNPEEIIVVTETELKPYSRGPNINMKSIYPTGILLQSRETGGISYVENGVRHTIHPKEILKSRFPNRKWIAVENSTIEQYPLGEPIKFKNGELVGSLTSKKIYVISNGQRRHISSASVFTSLGYQWSNVIWTNEQSMSIHPEGKPIEVVK